jgi:hypothetical protein
VHGQINSSAAGVDEYAAPRLTPGPHWSPTNADGNLELGPSVGKHCEPLLDQFEHLDLALSPGKVPRALKYHPLNDGSS